MKLWKGIWIIVVALMHTLFAFSFLGPEYEGIVSRGIIGSVNSTESSLAAWFFLFGVFVFALGLIVLSLERNDIDFPKSGGLCLLLMVLLGAALMPKSGFWLLIPPLLVICVSKNEGAKAA